MSDDRLGEAIGFVQAGKMNEARDLLEQVLKADRANIHAWHWYAQTWPETKDKIRVWEACLRFNPTSQQAQETLRHLRSAQRSVVEAPVPMVNEVKSEPRQVPTSSKQIKSLPARSSAIGLWAGLALVIATAVGGILLIMSFVPKNPENYHHTDPVEYYLYVPEGYTADREWPLFVGIHGSGGSGLDCWNMWQSDAEREGYILLCPSIPGDPSGYYQDVGEKTVWSAVGEVKKDYRVRKRMFFAGFSAGAFFIQGFNYHYPDYVSGLAILSSGVYLNPRLFPQLIPMTVVIGDSDDPAAVNSCLLFVSDLQKNGFDVQFNLLQGVGHTFTSIAHDVTIELFRKVENK